MKVTVWPIGRVRPYADNPREIPERAVRAVARSIEAFGFRQPIVVDAKGVIIVGHTRWLAAKSLGMKRVPVHVAAGLTPEQARAYRVADNQTATLAEWDWAKLIREVGGLSAADFDLAALGFSDRAIAALLDGTSPPELTGELLSCPRCGREFRA